MIIEKATDRPHAPEDEEAKGGPNDHGRNEEIEKIKHGLIDEAETGAPRGQNRSNAGEETS